MMRRMLKTMTKETIAIIMLSLRSLNNWVPTLNKLLQQRSQRKLKLLKAHSQLLSVKLSSQSKKEKQREERMPMKMMNKQGRIIRL